MRLRLTKDRIIILMYAICSLLIVLGILADVLSFELVGVILAVSGIVGLLIVSLMIIIPAFIQIWNDN